MPPKLVVISCGTSLLSHGVSNDTRTFLNRIANQTEEELSAVDREEVDRRIREVQKKLQDAELHIVQAMSAELNCLVSAYRSVFPAAAEHDMHYLLCTDTYVGEQAAKLLKNWFLKVRLAADVIRLRGMSTRDSGTFHEGIVALAKWCSEVLSNEATQGYEVIFNLAGGFKAMQGALHTFGTFYADELLYIFESGQEVIRIPRLPLSLDAEGIIKKHLREFRLMALDQTLSPERVKDIPESLIYRLGDQVELSEWGLLLWDKTYRKIYRQHLLPSPAKYIQFGPRFADSVRDYDESERMVTINEKISDLVRYIASGRKTNPNSLDFKRLRGNLVPPSTHECDAWHDGAAKRIFCHWEDGTLVLDRLADSLH